MKQPQPEEPNNLAIASLVLGILSILGTGPIAGIPAIITGIMALKQPGSRSMALTGLILGSIATAFVVIIGFIVLLFLLFGLFAASNFHDSNMHFENMEPSVQSPFQQQA